MGEDLCGLYGMSENRVWTGIRRKGMIVEIIGREVLELCDGKVWKRKSDGRWCCMGDGRV